MAESNQDPEQFVQDTGRWSYHLANKPSWVTADNESWAQGIYNNAGADPNAAIQDYLGQQRAGQPEGGEETDAILLGQKQGSGGGGGAQSSTQQWNNQPTNGEATTEGRSNDQYGQNSERNTALWNELWGRTQQSKNIDRNDPIIRAQADAYSANEQRSSRDYLADVAESAGPLANLRGEQRMAAEKTGQRTGAFEANLMGQELAARRQEISDSLNGLRGMLTTDQQQQMQRELSVMDSQLRRMGYDQNWNMALMQNDQFSKDLGLRAEDRASYWDAVRRGIV